jgi:hypothetical protein
LSSSWHSTTQPHRRRRGHHLRKPQCPCGQHTASKKETTLKRRHWPIRQSRPRVSPGTKGRDGLTQEHASNEGVAPAGVTVVRIGTPSWVFTPAGDRTPAKWRRAATRIQRPPQKATYRRGGARRPRPWEYPARQEGTEMVTPEQGRYLVVSEQDLRPCQRPWQKRQQRGSRPASTGRHRQQSPGRKPPPRARRTARDGMLAPP